MNQVGLIRFGGVAQLVERLLCKQEVIGSIPFTSTSLLVLFRVCGIGCGFLLIGELKRILLMVVWVRFPEQIAVLLGLLFDIVDMV